MSRLRCFYGEEVSPRRENNKPFLDERTKPVQVLEVLAFQKCDVKSEKRVAIVATKREP